MTVLAIAGSREGIAIAADGRRIDENGTPQTDCAQKVWRNRSADHWDLVVGWAGSPEIDAGLVRFSFPSISKEIWKTLELGNLPKSFSKFAALMRSRLQDFLDAHVNPYPSEISSDRIRIQTLMGTFAGDKAICAAMVFYVKNGQAEVTRPEVETLTSGYVGMVGGSSTLWRKRAQFDAESATLPEAIKEAEDYVQACIKGNGTIPDCAAYGGHVHVGVVTAQGFRWEKHPAHHH
jgi:hypothetical protein